MRYTALSMALGAFLFVANQKVLFDYRPLPTKPEPARMLSAEARRNLLSTVFRRYLRDERECKVEEASTEAALESARNNGQIVPEVLSQAGGSFTRSGGRQVAYLIKVGECSAPGRTYFGTYRLVVFENGRLITDGQSPSGDHIDTWADVAGNGMEAILISGCAFGQGVLECSATLVSIAGGSVKAIQEFPSVYVDQCESAPDSSINASVIRYAPGHPLEFSREEYEAKCPGPGQTPQFRPAGRATP